MFPEVAENEMRPRHRHAPPPIRSRAEISRSSLPRAKRDILVNRIRKTSSVCCLFSC